MKRIVSSRDSLFRKPREKAMAETVQKGVDEKFCFECGAIIKDDGDFIRKYGTK